MAKSREVSFRYLHLLWVVSGATELSAHARELYVDPENELKFGVGMGG